ncbi:MAG: tRNA pseudouridine(55) synthase TruB, partial [Bacilli bacterium]|nr:tRNA pseudouridine(55) synthase TruB [Bacilli bacterium]
MNGFFLIDKDSDWTSRDVCNKIQHLLHVKKVGHTGTLDPFATGLLMVSIGNGTKAGTFLEDFDKEYEATLVLGKKTSTGDIKGEEITQKDIPEITKEDIEKVFDSFIGIQKQTPPMTSAVHYQGRKLYELAHQGIEVEREQRVVEIKSIKLLDFNQKTTIKFKAKVSKGTYIRVLGEDIAERLGTVGYLSELRRISVGPYSVENAIKLEEVSSVKPFSIFEILSKHLPVY